MSDSVSRRKLARAAFRLARQARAYLPPLVLMTDDERLPEPLASVRALPRGSMVIVRAREAARRKVLAEAILKAARARSICVLIAGDFALARALGAHGVHLPETRIGEASALRARGRLLVTAAVHCPAAFRKTAALDAVFLSPVFPTASHPGRTGLSPLRANILARLAPVPVYALGGITARNVARLSGFCGLAAIGALKNG